MVSSQRGRFSRLPRCQKLSIACSMYITRMLPGEAETKFSKYLKFTTSQPLNCVRQQVWNFRPNLIYKTQINAPKKILKQGKGTIGLLFKSVVELLGSAAIKMQEKQVKSKITYRSISTEFKRKELIKNFRILPVILN